MAKGGSNGKGSSAVGGGTNGSENQNNEAMGGAMQEGRPNDSTEYYVSGDGMWINNDLRNGNTDYWSESDKQYLKEMDAATNGAIDENTLYRSVDASAVFGNIDSMDYENIVGVLENGNEYLGSGSYAASIRNQANNIINRAVGKEITDKGFMSTTATASVADNWGSFTGSDKPMVIKFTNARNQKGVDVSLYDKSIKSGYDAQNERLLARNTSYKINRISARNGQIYVEAEFTNNKKK